MVSEPDLRGQTLRIRQPSPLNVPASSLITSQWPNSTHFLPLSFFVLEVSFHLVTHTPKIFQGPAQVHYCYRERSHGRT